MKDRNHLYLYTVEVRGKKLQEGGFEWIELQEEGYNKEQVAHKLGKKLEDVRYKDKRIIQ